LGTAILKGIITNAAHTTRADTNGSTSTTTNSSAPVSTTNGTANGHSPTQITSFIACTSSRDRGLKLRKGLGISLDDPLPPSLTLLVDDNAAGITSADIILLACKPDKFASILCPPAILSSLSGKLLISILAGVPVKQITSTLWPGVKDENLPCRVVRAMPNTASAIGESMTVIADPSPPLPAHLSALVTSIFSTIGQVATLKPALMDAATALCGSGPAFFALMLEAMIEGAVNIGIPWAEAQLMAAQVMKGTADMVLAGEEPGALRRKVCTPGGCTIGGLQEMKDGRLDSTIGRGLGKARDIASGLGVRK
jgi:pyrroline-5-carboxylate reductase